jgi:hypothetical protein
MRPFLDYRGIEMALSNGDRALIREIARETAEEFFSRIDERIDEKITVYQTTCPAAIFVRGWKMLLVGVALGSGLAGSGITLALKKLF